MQTPDAVPLLLAPVQVAPNTHVSAYQNTTDITTWHVLHAAQAAANGQCSYKSWMGILARERSRHFDTLMVVCVGVQEHGSKAPGAKQFTATASSHLRSEARLNAACYYAR